MRNGRRLRIRRRRPPLRWRALRGSKEGWARLDRRGQRSRYQGPQKVCCITLLWNGVVRCTTLARPVLLRRDRTSSNCSKEPKSQGVTAAERAASTSSRKMNAGFALAWHRSTHPDPVFLSGAAGVSAPPRRHRQSESSNNARTAGSFSAPAAALQCRRSVRVQSAPFSAMRSGRSWASATSPSCYEANPNFRCSPL